MKVVTHEDYLVEIAVAVCEQYPATTAALSEVRLVFGSGMRRRGVTTLHRVWGVGAAEAALPLVEIAAVGGLSPAETCHVVLHELAHAPVPVPRRRHTPGRSASAAHTLSRPAR